MRTTLRHLRIAQLLTWKWVAEIAFFLRVSHGCDTRTFSERTFRLLSESIPKVRARVAVESWRQIAEHWTESGTGRRSPALPQINRLVTLSGRVENAADDGP